MPDRNPTTVQYNTVQYNTVQYQYSIVLVLQVFKQKIEIEYNFCSFYLKIFFINYQKLKASITKISVKNSTIANMKI
jgi:hypothetical protein